MKKSAISISQKPNEIIIKINEQAEQEDIIKELKKKIKDLRKNVQRRKNTNKRNRQGAKNKRNRRNTRNNKKPNRCRNKLRHTKRPRTTWYKKDIREKHRKLRNKILQRFTAFTDKK